MDGDIARPAQPFAQGSDETHHAMTMMGRIVTWGVPTGELGATFETMATLLNATMRGLVLTAPSVPDIATQRIQATPFETAGAEWSQPALGIATIALGFLEPDPTIEWDDERLTTIRQALRS